MSVLDRSMSFFLKPRVVHSIPGRLRLHSPLLKRVKLENKEWLTLVTELISTPDGIDEVKTSVTTGSILLQYDSKKLTETEIMSFISSLTTIFQSHRQEFEQLFEEHPAVIMDRLKSWLQNALSQRLHLDEQLRIPTDVFQ